jgi:hypothetical protein
MNLPLMELIFQKTGVLLGGMIGAIVALTYESKITITKAFTLLITGTATAYYTSEFAVNYFELDPKHVGAISYILGLIGMRICSAFLSTADYILNHPKILIDIFKKKLD